MRKSPLGILSLNAALQRAVNPPDYTKNEKQRLNSVFREKDKVIQVKNNYNLQWKVLRNGKMTEEGQGVFNGDEGIISAINDDEEKLSVIFDENRHVTYDYSQLDELELSYAITVHKSQGSEYGVVVIPVHSGPHMLMNRNILYTAVTRAKKMVVLVGTEEALRKMVDNNRQVERFSTLRRRLRKLKEMFG
jgi:exodeoxyribonuclease V alpha subunit